MTNRVLVLAIAALLAGCGGGSAMQSTLAPPSQMPQNTASIVSTIVVPGAMAASEGRRPQYVSASTLGLVITVSDIAPAGQTPSFTPIVTAYTLSTGRNQIVAPTPASAAGHTEDITYVAYTAAPINNVAMGKAVGWGLTTGFTVVPGQNTNNITLSGVVDGFPAPLSQSGSFGMMSAAPPALAGPKVASATSTLLDAGNNNITTAPGGPWPVVGAVPTVATLAATGVPVTIVETPGTCGASGNAPHLLVSFNGSTPATSTAITNTSGALTANYDGSGGAGWYATVTAKAQTQSLAFTLSNLAVTATSNDFSCTNQTLSFSQSNEIVTMNVVQHTAVLPYTITVPNTPSCTRLVNVYAGSSRTSVPIAYGTPTSLGASTTFTVQLIPSPPGPSTCNIEIQDFNSAISGSPAFPGATTYVSALLPSNSILINVP